MGDDGSMWLEENVRLVLEFDYEDVDLEKLASELSPDARKRIFEPAPDAATVTPDSECASSKSTVALAMDEALKKSLAFPFDSTQLRRSSTHLQWNHWKGLS